MKTFHFIVTFLAIWAWILASSSQASINIQVASERTHLLLLQLAEQDPDQTVKVIIQKANASASMINTFAATMKARAASQ